MGFEPWMSSLEIPRGVKCQLSYKTPNTFFSFLKNKNKNKNLRRGKVEFRNWSRKEKSLDALHLCIFWSVIFSVYNCYAIKSRIVCHM